MCKYINLYTVHTAASLSDCLFDHSLKTPRFRHHKYIWQFTITGNCIEGGLFRQPRVENNTLTFAISFTFLRCEFVCGACCICHLLRRFLFSSRKLVTWKNKYITAIASKIVTTAFTAIMAIAIVRPLFGPAIAMQQAVRSVYFIRISNILVFHARRMTAAQTVYIFICYV